MSVILLGKKESKPVSFREWPELRLKIVKFGDRVIVERGCVTVKAGQKSRLSRKEREQAAGRGWTAEEWRVHLDLHGNRCLSCGSGEYLVPDHVVPLYRGGTHDLSNIQPLCKKCNFAKGLKIVDYRGLEQLCPLPLK